jgi:hypothetical protein
VACGAGKGMVEKAWFSRDLRGRKRSGGERLKGSAWCEWGAGEVWCKLSQCESVKV